MENSSRSSFASHFDLEEFTPGKDDLSVIPGLKGKGTTRTPVVELPKPIKPKGQMYIASRSHHDKRKVFENEHSNVRGMLANKKFLRADLKSVLENGSVYHDTLVKLHKLLLTAQFTLYSYVCSLEEHEQQRNLFNDRNHGSRVCNIIKDVNSLIHNINQYHLILFKITTNRLNWYRTNNFDNLSGKVIKVKAGEFFSSENGSVYCIINGVPTLVNDNVKQD